ncbi:hypothetical protein [Massilia sp. Leaf139]|uniref:hypothetical protein n=1 Tax=Massilia sp. Leaf139 TaxID=1736272 RepID=UPI0012E8F6CE|nr:hypothetical protein [Massilia sp. Leaf139]
MKTQLLEDIGQSAESLPTPSQPVAPATARKEVHQPAPEGNTTPARQRTAAGVWRKKSAAAPVIPTSPQPEPQPTPVELQSVLEELAALEAQYVPPGAQQAPAVVPAELEHVLATPSEAPLPAPDLPPAEPTPPPMFAQDATVPRDPLFDFTEPLPPSQAPERAANPFTRAPAAPARSRRYAIWGASALAVALLALGGHWLYQERNDSGSLALIANEAQQTVKAPAIAARTSTPRAEAEAAVTPPEPASRPASSVPPLVMLKPDPPAAAKPEPPSPPAVDSAEPEPPAKAEPVVQQKPAPPLPKRTERIVRKPSDVERKRVTKPVERPPVRQAARAAAVATGKPAGLDTSMEATLKACREHGYHAAQCVKRDCRVTEYGFVCRGR